MISWFYSAIFWFMIFAWPYLLRDALGQPYVALVFVANIAVAAFVIYQCSSMQLNFIRGMDVVAGCSMSGCANITILYLPPLLAIVYLIALYHSVVSLFRGREYSQARWLALVNGFYKRRMNTPLNPLRHLAAPNPSNFEIDPEDPQNLLEAGSHWEIEGEWERAISLYQQAADKLRGQDDAVYAENCIQRVRDKIARAQEGGSV